MAMQSVGHMIARLLDLQQAQLQDTRYEAWSATLVVVVVLWLLVHIACVGHLHL